MADDFLLEAADRFLNVLSQALGDDPAEHVAVEAWSARLIAEVRAFERSALRVCGDAIVVTDASYLLCTLGDELSTERFGMRWAAVGLLVRHHGDAHGGQRSWARLDALLHDADDQILPTVHPHRLALLRLYERAIVLGLRGRHGVELGGEQTLDGLRLEIRDRLNGEAGDPPVMADLVQLATRHVQQRGRRIGVAVAGLSLAMLLLFFLEIRRDIDARWDAAAADMVGAVNRGANR